MSATAANEISTADRRSNVVLFTVAACLSLIGLADSIYLTVEHLSGRTVLCTVVSGCSEVLRSTYATVGRVPLALIGAVAYFTSFSLATLAAFGNSLAGQLLTIVVGLMFLVTLWLLYLQAFVIGSFCQFCLLSAAVTTALLVTVVFLRISQRY